MSDKFIWAFNFKVFTRSYGDLGYNSQLDDWNVRFSDGEVLLDNTYTRSTTTFSVAHGVLAVEVRPWNLELASPKCQNINLARVHTGWRDSEFDVVSDPSPEAVALLEHLRVLGYLGGESVTPREGLDDDGDGYHGMKVQDFWGADC